MLVDIPVYLIFFFLSFTPPFFFSLAFGPFFPKKCMYSFDLISIEIQEKAQQFVYRISGLQAQLSTDFIALLHIQ